MSTEKDKKPNSEEPWVPDPNDPDEIETAALLQGSKFREQLGHDRPWTDAEWAMFVKTKDKLPI